MNSEVHNDTAPDSGGGVSAFETYGDRSCQLIQLYQLTRDVHQGTRVLISIS